MCITAKINFGKPKKNISDEKINDLVVDYQTQLMRRGQIAGSQYSWCYTNGQVQSFVNLTRPDSLLEKYHSQWCLGYIEKIFDIFGKNPTWKIVDDRVPKRFPNWRSSKGLVLYTDMFGYVNCVYKLNRKEKIPLYLLPLDDQEIEDIHFWIRSYRLHDGIWIGSGKLEIPAYKELADPTTELSTTGRELCSIIEKKTKIPTYYYMMRYWGRIEGEKRRRCPLCGDSWATEYATRDEAKFWEFDFLCEKCRLVSSLASSYDNQRCAHIGEYKSIK